MHGGLVYYLLSRAWRTVKEPIPTKPKRIKRALQPTEHYLPQQQRADRHRDKLGNIAEHLTAKGDRYLPEKLVETRISEEQKHQAQLCMNDTVVSSKIARFIKKQML